MTPALDLKQALPAADVMKQTLPLLESLADPVAVNGLTFTLPSQIIDMSVYYGPSRAPHKTISITDDGASLRLQSPAPVEQLLALLQSHLPKSNTPASAATLELPILPAWLCWAFVDLLRETARAGDALDDVAYDEDAIAGALERPFQLFTNLAAYFREALELSLPSKPEMQDALRQLIEARVITRAHSKFAAGGFLSQLAHDLGDVRAHLLFRTTARLPDLRTASMRNWIFQGSSGNGLLWHQAHGRVSMLNTSKSRILSLAAALLRRPALFFLQRPRQPAPPETLSSTGGAHDTARAREPWLNATGGFAPTVCRSILRIRGTDGLQ